MRKKVLSLALLILISFKFVLAYDQLQPNTISQTSSFIALTWDDNKVDEWFSIKDILMYYGVKCTFFVTALYTYSPTQINRLKILQNMGHEIACHGYKHLDAVEYSRNYGIDKYIKDEIIPAKQIMNHYGFFPNSFAYPYGSSNRELDKELKKYFHFLRGTTYYPKPDYGFLPALNGLGMDNKYSPIEFVLDEIVKEKDKQGFIILYGHTPKWGNTNIQQYETSLDRLVQIIKKAKALKMKFCTCKELGLILNNYIFKDIAVNTRPNSVQVSWKITPWNETSEFLIERFDQKDSWKGIGLVQKSKLNDSDNEFSFIDNSLIKDNTYKYRIKAINKTDEFIYSDEKEIKVKLNPYNVNEEIDKTALLNQNFPNPFNSTTVISYSLNKQSYVILKVFDMLGQEVLSEINKRQEAGVYYYKLDATNFHSGIYIYSLMVDNYKLTKKLMIVK